MNFSVDLILESTTDRRMLRTFRTYCSTLQLRTLGSSFKKLTPGASLPVHSSKYSPSQPPPPPTKDPLSELDEMLGRSNTDNRLNYICLVHGSTMETASTRKKKSAFSRKCIDSHLKFGFLQCPDTDQLPRPQCVICATVNEAMKPSRLTRRLSAKHFDLVNKPIELFKHLK
jgi:hypothetical protein